MSSAAPSPFIIRLFSYFKWLEMILLAALFISAVLYYADMDVSYLILFSLLTLSGLYFLKAYQPPKEFPENEKERKGMSELMGYVMIPKLIYISMSISLVGVLFYILKIEGSDLMLMIGSLSLGGAILVIGFLIVSGLRYKERVLPDVYRAVPVAFAAAYLLFR